jgi:hypothetical protein
MSPAISIRANGALSRYLVALMASSCAVLQVCSRPEWSPRLRSDASTSKAKDLLGNVLQGRLNLPHDLAGEMVEHRLSICFRVAGIYAYVQFGKHLDDLVRWLLPKEADRLPAAVLPGHGQRRFVVGYQQADLVRPPQHLGQEDLVPQVLQGVLQQPKVLQVEKLA